MAVQGDGRLSPAFGSDYWNDRYRSGDTGWDLGTPSPPFVRLHEAGQLAPCRMAVPGCGRGWEVAYFAGRGFHVTAIDFAPEAIAATRMRLEADGIPLRGGAAGEAPADGVDLVQADLFDLPARLAGAFDLVLEQTCFCAVDPARRPDYVAAVHRLLAPGGRLIGLFYDFGEDGGPPFTTDPDEVRALFSGRFEVRALSRTPDSHPRRQGEEWLGVLLRR